MPFSSGTFSVFTPGTPYSAGNTISSSVANSVNTDFATGLSTCVLKDGSQVLTANIPFANFKITGLGAGSALTDSATLRQVQYGFGAFLTSVAGTNTVTGTATPTPAYTVGQLFTFVPAVTNTGPVTLNISSVGAGAVQWAGAALTGGELVAGTAYTVYVTAATPVFEIVGATQFPDSRALVVGATDATKKLRFEVDGITTATTRVATMLDADFSIGSATQAQQETGTSLLVSVTPGVQNFHPSAAKFWAYITVSGGTPTLQVNFNVASITDTAAGRVLVTIATDFSSANWTSFVTGLRLVNSGAVFVEEAHAAGSLAIVAYGTDFSTPVDPETWSCGGFGDQ